jgi:hypothetical protein
MRETRQREKAQSTMSGGG